MTATTSTTTPTTTFYPGDAILTRRIKRYCQQHNLYFMEHGHWQRYGRRGRHYKVDRYVADANVVRREMARREQEIVRQHREREERRRHDAEQWMREMEEMNRIFRELDDALSPKRSHRDYIDWREFGF